MIISQPQAAKGHLKWESKNGGLEAVFPVGSMGTGGVWRASPQKLTALFVQICYFVTVSRMPAIFELIAYKYST